MKRFIAILGLLLITAPLVADGRLLTVVNAYDLTATSYTYCVNTANCGTAATSGWIAIPKTDVAAATVEWVTKAATSLDYSVECRAGNTGLNIDVEQYSMTSASNRAVVMYAFPWDACRIGLKLTTDSGTNSVNAYFTWRRQ